MLAGKRRYHHTLLPRPQEIVVQDGWDLVIYKPGRIAVSGSEALLGDEAWHESPATGHAVAER
jgi:hypothetical protein